MLQERRSRITPGIAQAIVFTDPKGTSLNLLQADNINIHHLAFELRDEAEEINRACDFLARQNVKLFWGPIRHLIGHNIAIYHKNPDGITVEFFTDIDLMFDEEFGVAVMAASQACVWERPAPRRHRILGARTRRQIKAPTGRRRPMGGACER
jgi:hypothetical protein